MQFNQSYRSISLDTIANAATHHLGQPPKGQSPKEQSPKLRGNQSHRLLTLILGRWFMPCPDNIFKKGNPFHARTQASHAALGASLQLGREWVCDLTGRLVKAGWIKTSAPRLPDGKQEVTTYRPGKRFKQLLTALLKSPQRNKNRVVDQQQKVPTKEEREKNKALFADLIAEVGEKFAMKKAIKW